MILGSGTILHPEWIKLTIDNCDCSGILELNINCVLFHNINTNNSNDHDQNCDQLQDYVDLMKKFANKFTALKKLEFKLQDESRRDKSLFLWSIFVQALEPIISKNDTLVLSNIPMAKEVDIKITVRLCLNQRLKRHINKQWEYILSNPNDNYTVLLDEYDQKKWSVLFKGYIKEHERFS